MNKIAAVYCFDNENQYNMFLSSLRTIEDQQDIDILLIIKENCIDNDKLSLLKEKFGDRLKIVFFAQKIYSGMFYWLMAPLITEYEFYIQLDNDTLINNINLKDLITKYKNKIEKNLLLVSVLLREIKKGNSKVIQYYRKNKFDFYTKSFKYLNTGVVIINGNRVRNFLSTKGFSERNINYFIKTANINKFMKTDQEYLHIFFCDELDFIHIKYNVRMHILYDIKRARKKKHYIAHYNIYSTVNKTWLKFDFIKNLREKNIDEFSEEISEFWASSEHRSYRKKNKYKKIIKKYYNDLKK